MPGIPSKPPARIGGFTLIELLVVIAIIGILSSVVLASLNAARASARDARRLADIRQVALALELYRTATGSYPDFSVAAPRENSCFGAGTASDTVSQWDTVLAPVVAGGYLPAIPRDPQNNGVVGGPRPYPCYGYHRDPGASTFNACQNILSGEMLYPRDYEYLLYFSLENPAKAAYNLYWNGNAIRPVNACYPGPRR